jgi:hypothetical protein
MRKQKFKLTKDWHFTHYNGPQKYDKGREVRGKWLDEKYEKQGLFIEHFYGYGQGEIIPVEFFN